MFVDTCGEGEMYLCVYGMIVSAFVCRIVCYDCIQSKYGSMFDHGR